MPVALSIDLTGALINGKSTVGRMFEKFGVPMIDANWVTREIVSSGTPALQIIIEHFGATILHSSEALGHAHLPELVFAHGDQRRKLEAIVHPLVHQEGPVRDSNSTRPTLSL